MRPPLGEYSSQAVSWLWGMAIAASAGIHALTGAPLSDSKTFAIAFIVGAGAGVVGVVIDRATWGRRLALFWSSVGFSMAFGPLCAHVIIAQFDMRSAMLPAVVGASAFWGLFGLPFFIALRAFLIAADKANAAGSFLGAFARELLHRNNGNGNG